MRVLIAGGAGYIGGVTAKLFQEAGHDVVVFDNLSTGHRHNLQDAELVVGDLTKPGDLQALFDGRRFDVVLNFAAKIQVEESMRRPRLYFENNSFGALRLIDAAVEAHVKNFIFSSTAAVYGQPETVPIPESAQLKPINPYGLSKLLVEQMLANYQLTSGLGWTSFRYFNAAGAYRGIGPEYPVMTHLVPKAIEAVIQSGELKVFGHDYDTPDGTALRDYVHVYDIAKAHVLAAEQMAGGQVFNRAINLGTGRGHSVLEVVKTLEKVAGRPIKYQVTDRRPGDPAALVASNRLAQRLLGWSAERGLEQIIADAYAWRRALRG
ncbi:UDP-glucose 4-epimerase GalE [Candidatus Parcubacteria bacterium]|nr:UDP-glucose 4-epimerase GalE [Candidatus Parcubacteria bacterium]